MQTRLLLGALATACNTPTLPTQPAVPPDTRAADKAAIRAADVEWVSRPEPPKTGSSPPFLLRRPNAPAAIQKAFTGLLPMPGFALTFAPTKVEVAHSGDLAYETGDYELTTNDKQGKPQTTKAKYVIVWGKRPNGASKTLVDSPTTTTPYCENDGHAGAGTSPAQRSKAP